MKHISVLVPEGDSSLSNLEATYKMFTMANDALKRAGKPPLFSIHLVGMHKKAKLSNGLFSITPNTTISDIQQTDLIIIPAIHGDYKKVISDNIPFIRWIKKQYDNGAEIASLCIGAFLLASTGLLDGKDCATHWLAACEFREMFPEVNLIDDKIITDENGLYTSGGAYSSLNLNLYLIEKFAGREMAVLSSKIFEIDISRDSQSPFIIFKGQKSHDDEEILKIQEHIEQNFQHKITVDDLSEKIAVSRRTFERRFKKATSNTVVEYLQRVKIEAAKKELERGRKTVNEVMYEVGYTDPKAFREVFKKYTAITPSEYSNKYNKVKQV
ncbi:GlxA family transcriptional regulator [Tenacibaculum caenipelagi]|uniref:AraC family transcriptional regulator with amidase-like domain n=1 Tax=Tenacibaculum caenipelagi TaxID=1325435 RepID=A0A4R6TP84_9FLAO|nr:helix-turn-helix domain-containing protein [Tenacibaculum caenipelagi]TDQ30099.1 AraC family transcriptional regulator with amidase-like domain [Tenacibaculum caenipelagi]